MKLTNAEYSTLLNIFHDDFIEKTSKAIYSCSVVAKSTTEPGNSNYLLMANSTPKACFFIRSTRTPKENRMQIRIVAFLSMVACSGKGFALCCVPLVAVFQPVTRYRPKPGNFSVVTSSNLLMELSAMIYLFKAVNRSDLRNTAKHYSAFPKYTVRINADTLAQARAKIAPFFVVLREVCND
ncbi:Ash family protein [Pasteurella langaaensis DSM 22999]|uniref:Ash family protein n=1 Tax=Alitibacter langaaensis DSM 22999 TaxID=1122935 RepID=A0A2U0T849_9PAST|nr:ash family protein [Pasteurella langaaensis]PVX39781.1 Ash family protein [Pasteurella langaaensis DSM 22999]